VVEENKQLRLRAFARKHFARKGAKPQKISVLICAICGEKITYDQREPDTRFQLLAQLVSTGDWCIDIAHYLFCLVY
jgi:hypothetical protein